MADARLTRLGEGLKEGGSVTKEAAERTAAAIKGMGGRSPQGRCHRDRRAGTAGLRIATNAADVREMFPARTGVSVEVGELLDGQVLSDRIQGTVLQRAEIDR